MTINLKKLASSLGISETTVSRALNGYPEVSARTRERVLAAAHLAGYRPNPMARSLASGRTNVVGIIHPLPNELADPMFMQVVAGMIQTLETRQMDLIIAPVSQDNEMRSYQHMVHGKKVDGLIVSRTRLYDERITYLTNYGLPFVAHGRTRVNKPHAWFDYDNESGMRMAVDYLLSFGHQRIGLISAPLDMNFARQRCDSFKVTLQGAGISVNPAQMIDGANDRRSGYLAMQKILESPMPPSAVIVDNHMSGVGAVRALLDAGIKTGEQMSIIVWGTMEDSLAGHNVTTIEQPNPDKAGEKMIEMLLELQNGTPPSELQELWQPVLLPGETVSRYQPG
jgi:LacI family transcriptional regulator